MQPRLLTERLIKSYVKPGNYYYWVWYVNV